MTETLVEIAVEIVFLQRILRHRNFKLKILNISIIIIISGSFKNMRNLWNPILSTSIPVKFWRCPIQNCVNLGVHLCIVWPPFAILRVFCFKVT